MDLERNASCAVLPSRAEVLEGVQRVIAKQMDRSPEEIGEADHLMNDIGCDSLDIVEISMVLEDLFEVNVPEDVAQGHLTVAEVTDLVVRLLGEQASP